MAHPSSPPDSSSLLGEIKNVVDKLTTSVNDQISTVKDQIANLRIELSSSINELKSYIDDKILQTAVKISTEINTQVNALLKTNNEKLCYFIIDILKGCVPSFMNIKAEHAKIIANSFSMIHKLGSVDSAAITKYVETPPSTKNRPTS